MVTVDAAKTCTATFDLNTLTVTKAGTGTGLVTSVPARINCGADCSGDYTVGDTVTLTASPDAGSNFAGWSGDLDCSDGAVTMNAATSCTANFASDTFTLLQAGTGSGTVTSVPAGIDCAPDCSEDYLLGTEVTLTVSPDYGSYFTGWTGDPDCSDGIIIVDAAMSCMATFTLETHTLTAENTGTGSGTILSDPVGIDCGIDCSEDYPYGTEVNLTATPDTGSNFTGWSGDPDCSDGVVIMDVGGAGTEASFTPVADASVSSSSPTSNFGSATVLEVDGSAHQIAYLRFDVTGLSGAVQSARLRLDSVGNSVFGGSIHAISDISWSENTVNYNNRPVIDGPALDSLGAVTFGDIVEFDVTSAVAVNGTYSFAIDSNNSDGADYRSREDTINPPQLIITTDTGKTCTATFDVEIHALTVIKAGTGLGTITSDPAGIDCGADCSEDYTYGTGVTLTAIPVAGSYFAGWSGDPDCLDGTVAMDASKSCTATFTLNTLTVTRTGTGSGTVISTPAGITCGPDCSENYIVGDTVNLTSTPDTGSAFSGWSGDADCSDGTVTMNAAKTCTATFDLDIHTLTITKGGSATGTVTSVPAGINCGADCTEDYSFGTMATLTATPDNGYVFSGWSGDPDCSDGMVTMNAAKTCTATFDLNILTVIKTGTGTGTVTSAPAGIDCGTECSKEYPVGHPVTLTATPDTGSVFSGWNGDADCSDGTVMMNAAKTCNATFDLDIQTLTITKAGSGSGSVTSTPAGIDCGADCIEDYSYDTAITLTVAPDIGSVFAGWSGDADCSDGMVTMNATMTCTAIFDIAIHTLTVEKAGTGSGTVSSAPAGIVCGIDCAEDYAYSTAVSLNTNPVVGSYFAGWSGDADCSDSTVTMNTAKTCTATFTITPFITEVRVSASSDDAEESATGSMGLTSSDLELVDESSNQTIGMRFNGIDIPQGATINNAYIQFQVDEISTVTTSLTIQGEAAVDAPTFILASDNISSRARTTGSVGWIPASWPSAGVAGPDQQTPDIATVIKEIVDNPGWSSGNSMVIIITGTGKRVAESYNGTAAGAPLLHIEYSITPPGNQAPNCVAAADPETIILPTNTVSLLANVTDDGLPEGSPVTTTWSQVGGTECGSVTFDDPGALDATATFPSVACTHILRMTADDTELSNSCDVVVKVKETPALTDIIVSPDSAIVVLGGTQQFTAAGYDQDGDPMGITPVWTTTGGSIDVNGMYTATEAGDFIITATDGGVWGEATVTVSNTVTTLEVRVASNSDDAEESASGEMYLTSSDLELTFDGSDQTVGMRFNVIGIPQGAQIMNAYIQFQVDEISSDTTSLTIQGEAHDDAPTFNTVSGDISSRVRTAASEPWMPVPWIMVGESGPDQQTPDISSVIQEIVDRSGWTSGNSVAIIITGTGERVAESYNGTAAGAPLLHVEYLMVP
jgi:hypothetical protein